jgi:hypothetical protein
VRLHLPTFVPTSAMPVHARARIRTETFRILTPRPLPVGLRGRCPPPDSNRDSTAPRRDLPLRRVARTRAGRARRRRRDARPLRNGPGRDYGLSARTSDEGFLSDEGRHVRVDRDVAREMPELVVVATGGNDVVMGDKPALRRAGRSAGRGSDSALRTPSDSSREKPWQSRARKSLAQT